MTGKIKRSFTPNELSVAAATGYIRAIDRYYRPRVKTYAIDDTEPTRATDRDDGVHAEKIPGGYLLHISIADVAAHVPKDSPLDKAAQARAFTIYRPPARDPMFPFVLSENRFSLEHEQERLGVNITIEMDDAFRTQDVRFTRTLLETECLNYAGAARRMLSPGDDIALLAEVALGLRDNSQPPIQGYAASSDFYMDKTGLLRQGDEGTISAAKLVQVLMIYANNEIANFFNRTGLPFLFRNHDPGPDETGRAEYEPFDNGHYALRHDGLVGSYSHCTSPIRRYADLVNQRMQHYCMDVVEGVAAELASLSPEPGMRRKQDMMPVVWEHAEDLVSKVFAVHQAEGHKRIIAEKELKQSLRAIVVSAWPDADHEALYQKHDTQTQVMAAALGPALPYTHGELSKMTPTLNTAQAVEAQEVTELNRRNIDKWNDKVAEDLAAGHFEDLSENAFSGVLRRAAVTGRINEAFAKEAVKRFKNGEADTVIDCYSTLVLNTEYENIYWRAMKRAALNSIERDPMSLNNVFEKGMKEGEIHPETYVAEAMVRDSAAEEAMPLLQAAGIQQQVDAALVITYRDDMANREFAAPDYSVGYTRKDAARHAKFNFLRSMAFGELGPVDQTILPTPLYAELSHGRSRADVLHEMVESMDLTIREMGPHKRLDGKYSFAYQVYGPGIEYSLVGAVVEPTVEQAREKSATKILRNMQFKRAYANEHPVELGFPSNPAHVIRELAEASGWKLEEPERADIEEVERGVFRADIKLEIEPGDVLEVSSEARNKDNALLFAYETLRDKLDKRGLMPAEQRSKSGEGWVTWAASTRENGLER